jgi:hypothetical protein
MRKACKRGSSANVVGLRWHDFKPHDQLNYVLLVVLLPHIMKRLKFGKPLQKKQ